MSNVSPLSSASPPRTVVERSSGRVPVPLTPILGRNNEVRQVLALLDQDDLRLVTLVGPGGVGKTRLALEVARIAEREFVHGAWFVPLAAVRDRTLVPATVSRVLGIVENPLAPVEDQLRDALHLRHLLLVLDNLEHLAGVAAPWLIELLAHCPRLKVLATSRSSLHLTSEQRFLVAPLPVVETSEGDGRLGPALQLFVQRARAVRPDFDLNASNRQLVADVCQRLNGLPLAIELAAAQVTVLSVAEILERLKDQLTLLRMGRRAAEDRQHSMHLAINWSYDLLTLAEQDLFRRLSVFAGGFTLDAIEHVCTDRGEGAGNTIRDELAIDLTGSLVDQSLIALDARSDGTSRFSVLESVHTFAWQQLEAHGEVETCAARQADWCLWLVEKAEQGLVSEVDAAWLAVLEAEHDNLRRALEWSLDPAHDRADLALRMAGGLWLFWYYHSHLFEGRRWLERAVRASSASKPGFRAKALVGLGYLAHCQGDDDEALGRLTEGVAIFRSQGDRWATAFALSVRGAISEDQGDYDAGHSFFAEANALFGETGDMVNVAVTLYHLGVVAYGQGDLDLALTHCTAAMRLARDQHDPWTTANALSWLGLIHIDRDEFDEAATVLTETLALYGTVAKTERTVDVFRRIAVLAQVRGDARTAVLLFSAASAIGGQIGAVLALPESGAYDRALGAARQALSPVEWDVAWESGQRLDLVDALVEAHACLEPGNGVPRAVADHTKPAGNAELVSGLSERELEVLQLMAEGLSNQEIADRIFISLRTVTNHVTHIHAKLKVATRTAAVAYAIRNGLA